MKHPLLLLLFLPLHVFAQYRPSYSPPRPSYTPAPIRPGPSPSQMQQQSQQQAHQNFQRMQAQQTQQMQSAALRNQQQAIVRQSQQRPLLRQSLTPQQLEQQQAQQHEAEEQATDYLARFAQDQRSLRLAHPAADAQQAAAQQQEDAKQLTAVTVKTYREVFLPGQMTTALQALTLSTKGQQDLQNINKDLLDNAWWSKQEAASLNGKIAAHSNALAVLTAELLGFDIASPPPAPAPVSSLDNMLAKDSFDQLAAAQIIREATAAEKVIAGDRLAKAVTEFKNLGILTASRPELQNDPTKLRNEVKASLRKVNKEMQRYNARVGMSGRLYNAQKAMLKSTAAYLAKNGK